MSEYQNDLSVTADENNMTGESDSFIDKLCHATDPVVPEIPPHIDQGLYFSAYSSIL